jgi:predicted RNA polymerase sigma factor
MLIPLDEQDRTTWDHAMIPEGVQVLTAVLAEDRRGEYQVQAAIAALHDDAASVEGTDWSQILAWYDELLALTGNPLVELSRAVAVGEVDGPLAGLAALNEIDERLNEYHRLRAARAHLHERAGNHRACRYVDGRAVDTAAFSGCNSDDPIGDAPGRALLAPIARARSRRVDPRRLRVGSNRTRRSLWATRHQLP